MHGDTDSVGISRATGSKAGRSPSNLRTHINARQLLFRWFGDRPNISRHMYARDNTISSSWCVHFLVGRCCKNITISWNSSFCSSSDHVSRKLAHTYTRKSAKPSPSARYVSHNRHTRWNGNCRRIGTSQIDRRHFVRSSVYKILGVLDFGSDSGGVETRITRARE